MNYIHVWIIAILLVAFLVYIVSTYNTLVQLRNYVDESFATMDVYLKQRWDLVPNLVESVKTYMQHEQDTLIHMIKLRSESYEQLEIDKRVEYDDHVELFMSKMKAIAESNPELKSNANFLRLNEQLILIENDIATSRKYYNAVVQNLNTKVDAFPSNIIAKIFAIKKFNMYNIQGHEREAVRMVFIDNTERIVK